MKFIKYTLYLIISIVLLPIILFIPLIFLSAFFPDHTYRYYDFKTPKKIESKFGKVGIRVIPSYTNVKKETPKITNYGNPYEFWIFFDSNSSTIKEIKEVTISQNRGKNIKIGRQKAYKSAFCYKNIKLEHKKITVKLKIVFISKKDEILKEFEFIVKPEPYKEKKSNDFVDMIMSV